MIVLLLILTFLIAYGLGNLSGSAVLSSYVFRRAADRHSRAESPLSEFYRDFGVIGCAMLVLYDILRTLLAVAAGGWLLGFLDQAVIGKLFATFCLLLGQCYPLLFLFRGGKGLLCAGAAVFLIDWRVGLCCCLAFVVVVIFTRYTAIGSVLAAVVAPVFTWIFDLGYTTGPAWLPGVLALLCALVVLSKQVGGMLRIFSGEEARAFPVSSYVPPEPEELFPEVEEEEDEDDGTPY